METEKERRALLSENVESNNQKIEDIKHWSRKEKRIWLGLLFWNCASLYMVRVATPLAVSAMAQEMSWSKKESGAVLSSFFWGYTLTQVLSGYLSEKYGGEIILILAGACWSLFSFSTPGVTLILDSSYPILIAVVIVRILTGAAQGFHFPSVTYITSRRLHASERTFFFCFITAGCQTGVVILGFIGSFIIEYYGWRMLFYLTGSFAVTGILFLHFVQTKSRAGNFYSFDIWKRKIAKSPEQIKNSVPWALISSKLAFWGMLVCHICEATTWHILSSWNPTYFKEVFPKAEAAVYNVLPWFACIPSGIIGGFIAERLIVQGYSIKFVRKSLQTISQGVKFVALIGLGMSADFGFSLFCITLAAGASTLHHSAVMINPQDIAPNYAGSVFGIMNSAASITGFIGVYVTGHILSVTKSWSAVFYLTGFLNLFGGIAFLIFGEGKPIV